MREQAITALKTVIDPDVGVNIVDLGLVEEIAFEEGKITVSLIMTSPACPQGDYLAEECAAALSTVFPDATISVDVVPSPQWEPARMSEAARKQLGWGA